MLIFQNAHAKYEEKREEHNSETTPAIHRKELQEKGKHSFPYLNSMKSELSACMNCFLKLI